MNKRLLKELEEKLEKGKKVLEEQLRTFAKEDPNLKGDWDTKFPDFDGGLEEAADEVEEYNTLLPIEFNLETRLRDINLALKKIKKKGYGKCEKCGKKIGEKRLEVYPEARLCMKCQPR